MKLRNVLLLLAAAACAGLGPVAAEAAPKPRYQKTVENYSVPDVTLINQDRQQVRLRELVDSGKPVMVDFIYGTCTTICPVLSAGFSALQRKLENSTDVLLISFSIDPEHDTPAVMTEYLERYRAQPGWHFLTGTREDIDKVMHAFDAYVPNKMNHYPLTLMRAPEGEHWVRIYGLIGGRDLLSEYQALK